MRLVVAFALSSLLHIGIVFSSYLGMESSRTNLSGLETPHHRALLVTALKTQEQANSPESSKGKAIRETRTTEIQNSVTTQTSSNQEQTIGMGILPLSGLTYYASEQLTKRPQALTIAELDTPEIQRIIVSGKLILKLWIDDNGKVIDVLIEETTLPNIFARVASDAFLQSRFLPGEFYGRRVGSTMRIEVTYDDNRLESQ